jgi:type VI secretion system protein ImpE
MNADQHLRAGDLDAALRELKNEIRAAPADPKRRAFLWQLCLINGDWERANQQLDVLVELDKSLELMGRVWRKLPGAEMIRAAVFAGKVRPVVFGEPDESIAKYVKALQCTVASDEAAAMELRRLALEASTDIAAAIDLHPAPSADPAKGLRTANADWILDLDPRMGPMIEAFVEGSYYWIPLARIKQWTIEPTSNLRDLVWTSCHFWWTNGGENAAFVPARYPGSERDPRASVRLGKETVFTDGGGKDLDAPLGRRILRAGAGDEVQEISLLDVRAVRVGGGPLMPSMSGALGANVNMGTTAGGARA